MLRLIIMAAFWGLTVLAQPAKAATTVFGDSIFSQSGPVLNAADALGAADGASATLNRPGTLVINLAQAVTGLDLIVNGSRNANGTQVRISLGAIVGGVAVFTATQNFPNNAGGAATFDFSAECATISGGAGCTLISFAITGSPAANFSLDGVSGVSSAPEPGAWALMILAFWLVAARLKLARPHGRVSRALPRPAPSLI